MNHPSALLIMMFTDQNPTNEETSQDRALPCTNHKNRLIEYEQNDLHNPEGAKVKLLLDEMYAGLKEYFETLGWEVVSAQDVGLKGAKDRDIVEFARKNNLLLVTQDQKPADLAELKGVKHILISSVMIAKIADAKIKEKYPNVQKE